MKKSQVSMEFLMVMTIIFLMVLPLIIIYLTQSESIQQQITSKQAYKAAQKIRDAADEIYYSGYPSKQTINIYIPDRLTGIGFFQNYINFTFQSGQFDQNIILNSVANLTGNMTAYAGVHIVTIQALPDSSLPDQVLITDESD
jgi:uncharacterized protein (UPF0333 family)